MKAINLNYSLIFKAIIVTVIISLIPLSTLSTPSTQIKFKGFDPKLIDIDNPLGVSINSSALFLNASKPFSSLSGPPSWPFVTTLTSTASFKFNITGTVLQQEGEVHPIQISIFNPLVNDSFSVLFVHTPFSNQIIYGIQDSMQNFYAYEISRYSPNSNYEFQISYLIGTAIKLNISNSTWSYQETIPVENASVLKIPSVNLSFFAYPISGNSSSFSVFKNYELDFPAQDYFNYYTSFFGNNLFYIYLVLLFLVVFFWRREFVETIRKTTKTAAQIGKKIKIREKETQLLLLLLLSALFVQVSFSFLGSQPYDAYAQKSWSYISSNYGLKNLYPLSLISPSGRSVGTLSNIGLSYPYPPLLGYIYLLIGKAYWAISPTFDFNAPIFGLIMKTPWILATCFLGLVIYYFARKTFSVNISLILAALYLFNPTVIFESTVWGQSDAILASFLVIAVLSLLSGSKRTMWLFLGLSILTKQTAVVPAVFIAFFALAKYGFWKNLKSLVFPFVCIFCVVSPYLLAGYSPSFVFNVSIGQNVLNMIQTPQRVASWQIVASAGGHNIWPLITKVFFGQVGWSRFAFQYQPTNTILGLGFDRFGIMLVSICFIIILAEFMYSQKRRTDLSSIFYFLFLAIFSLYMFFTRMSPRYMYLAIPFLILSFGWVKNKKFFMLIYAYLTLTFLFSVYSHFALTSFWQPAYLPNFSPNANALNSAMFLFTTNDFYITALCLAFLSLFVLVTTYSIYNVFITNLGKKNDKNFEAKRDDILLTDIADKYKPSYFPTSIWRSIQRVYIRIFPYSIQKSLDCVLKPNSDVLELGCGKGSPLTKLSQKVNLKVAVDLHKPSLLENKLNGYFDNYVLADVRFLPFTENSFDYVVALDLIEHLSKTEGITLIKNMENICREKIVIVTPNGVSNKEDLEDSNVLQQHRSGWISTELIAIGFSVFGINGAKSLRGEQAHAVLRPRIFGHLLSKMTDRFIYSRPYSAFQLFCVKEKQLSI